jgi:hypothetical protein
MLSMCCKTNRKRKTYIFKHGTRVKADNSRDAIQILKSISIQEVSDVIKFDDENWVIHFGKYASIEIQEMIPEQAKKLGAWMVYLDRREPQLVN